MSDAVDSEDQWVEGMISGNPDALIDRFGERDLLTNSWKVAEVEFSMRKSKRLTTHMNEDCDLGFHESGLLAANA